MELRNAQIWVENRAIPLLSGEVHYWRLAPARWREILQQVREIGLEVVATYVPWQYHEYRRGKLDFNGTTEPQRNLVGFLNLLKEMGFWTIIRPGPYIYAEWQNAGVPDWAAKFHRLDPRYLELAEQWIASVCEVLGPHLATRQGGIIALQPCNEIDLFSHWFEEELGLDGRASLFQEFLAERYGEIDKLNQAWNMSYDSFADARCFAEPLVSYPNSQNRAKDYWRFQHWCVSKAAKWNADCYRKHGIDVPLFLNYYPGLDVQNWREMAKSVDFVGIDTYPSADFHAAPNEFRIFLEGLRYQSTISPLPYIAEFECGIWHGWHDHIGVLKANQYQLTSLSALGCGIKGFNWYMLVNRDNWYYCPIQEGGRVRGDLFPTFRKIHEIYSEIQPAHCERVTKCSAVFDPLHCAVDKIQQTDPMLQALYDADIDYEMFDPEAGQIAKPLMFYAGSNWLSEKGQQHLVQYVEDGGTLVCCQNAPFFSDFGSPINLLKIRRPSRVMSRLGKRVSLDLGQGKTALCEGSIWVYDDDVPEPFYAEQTLGTQQAVENSEVWPMRYLGKKWRAGYVEQRGKGRVVVIGLAPNSELLRAIHARFAGSLPSCGYLRNVQTFLLRRESGQYVICANVGDEEKRVAIELSLDIVPSGLYEVTDLWRQSNWFQPIDADNWLTVYVERKSAGIFRLDLQRGQ
jgi:hypothetical protein